MQAIETFRDSISCPRCGEEPIAAAWSGYISAVEVRDFWRCSKCGSMFETLRLIDAEQTTLPTELAEEFFPSLLLA